MLCSGCSLLLPDGPRDTGGRDAQVDAPDATPEGSAVLMPTGLRPPLARHSGCLWLDDSPLVVLTVTSECTIETEEGCELRCDPPLDQTPSACTLSAGEAEHAQAEVCLIVVDRLEIAATGSLRAAGSAAVAIVAAGPILVEGVLYADGEGQWPGPGGALGGRRGYGGRGPGSGSAGESSRPGGGAGHGGWGGAGGCSGGGEPGRSHGDCLAFALLGGSGGGGGQGEEAFGGGGGGALHLYSAERVEIARGGDVSASGGDAPDIMSSSSGGGGGGSGGTVILEAPEVVVDGAVRAHGGRGGLGGEEREGGSGGWGNEIDGEEGWCGDGANTGGGGAVGRVFVRTAAGTWDGTGRLSPELTDCATHSWDAVP